MSNVPVYLLVNLGVQDAAGYRKYEKGFFPVLKRHGENSSPTTTTRTPLKAFQPDLGEQSSSSPPRRAMRGNGMLTRNTKPCPSTAGQARNWSS